MANEEIKKDEMNLEAKETVNQEISDEELDNVSGGGLRDGRMYTSDGLMVTTVLNSCNQWKCKHCGTYSGQSGCYNHPMKGARFCPDCKSYTRRSIVHLCTYWKSGM